MYYKNYVLTYNLIVARQLSMSYRLWILEWCSEFPSTVVSTYVLYYNLMEIDSWSGSVFIFPIPRASFPKEIDF